MVISSFGIVGAGTMGGGIAQLVTQKGIHVSTCDTSDTILHRSLEEIEESLDSSIPKKIDPDVARRALSIIVPKRIDELAEEDLMLECVPEDLELKRHIIGELDVIIKKGAILATNTSSLGRNDRSAGVSSGRGVVAMHFFSPVWALSLVELVVQLRVSRDCVFDLKDFFCAIRRKIVEVEDSLEFIVNRLLFAMLAQAVELLDQRVASMESIDLAMRTGANQPMGPFEFMDFVGPDVVRGVVTNLSCSLPDGRYNRPPGLIQGRNTEVRLRKNVERGFYDY